MTFWDFANNNPITALIMVGTVVMWLAFGIGNMGPFVVYKIDKKDEKDR